MILRGIRILKWPEIWIGDSQGLGTEERDRDARGRMQQQLRGAQPVIREAGVLCLRRKDLRVLVHHGLLDDVIPFDRSMQQNPSPASARRGGAATMQTSGSAPAAVVGRGLSAPSGGGGFASLSRALKSAGASLAAAESSLAAGPRVCTAPPEFGAAVAWDTAAT